MADPRGLSGDEILAAEDIQTKAVEVPEWGGTVYVRTLTGVQRMEWSKVIAELNEEGSQHLLPACAVVFTLCKADGVSCFDRNLESVKALAAKSGAAILKVFTVADEVNAFTEKAMEELEEN